MKGREVKGAPSADLLVCFPSRAHLTLMPKPICSPARPSEPAKRHYHLYQQNHHRRKKSTGRGIAGPGQASPLLWTKSSKQMRATGGGFGGTPEIAEPTSPKVTCAGQIKVRPTRSSACRNWQSVMEEIERIHNNGKQRKRSSWAESFGFKKEVMQFLTCLRSIRFDFRCFGSFPDQDIASDDDEDEDENEDDDEDETQVGGGGDGSQEGSRTVFSKWFMVLQENQGNGCTGKERDDDDQRKKRAFDDKAVEEPAVPPPNALLLMRCRSAPVQSRLEQRETQEGEEEESEDEEQQEEDQRAEQEVPQREDGEQKKKKKRESLAMVMKYDTDFYKLSSDIAKETWVVGGLMDPLSRSRSWKR